MFWYWLLGRRRPRKAPNYSLRVGVLAALVVLALIAWAIHGGPLIPAPRGFTPEN